METLEEAERGDESDLLCSVSSITPISLLRIPSCLEAGWARDALESRQMMQLLL